MRNLSLLRRLRALVERKSVERELEEELRFHLQMQQEENERSGMTEEEARTAARRGFGSVAGVMESCREEKGLPLAESVAGDVRYGARKLVRSPLYSSAVLLTLALGIGANAAVFSLVHTVLLRPLPFRDPDRIVVLWENDRIRKTTREAGSYPDFRDIRQQARRFEAIAGASVMNRTLTGQGEPERLEGALVTEDYFRVMGTEPALGRSFLPAEFAAADQTPVIIGDRVWESKFGRDPAVLGTSVILDGVRHTVVGVAPRELRAALAPFHTAEVWMPLLPPPSEQYRAMHNVMMFGRLGAGTSLSEAQAELTGIMSRLEQAYEDHNKGRGAEIVPLGDQLVGGSRRSLQVLQASVALVLLIGCLNLASLLMARLTARRNELALRAALGAGRGRLVRQLLTETLLLVFSGGCLAIGLAVILMRAMTGLDPEIVPRVDQISFNWPVLAFLALVSLITAAVFGVGPALAVSNAPADQAWKAGTRTTRESPRARRVRESLVTVQVALALLLLVSAGVLLKSFWRLSQTEPGYDPRGVLQLSLELPSHRYPPPPVWPLLKWPEMTRTTDRLSESIGSLPGVESVSLALHSPLSGGWTTRVTVVGQPVPAPGDQDEAEFSPVDEAYFQTLRIPLKAGRVFAPTDDERHSLVAVVNQAFASRHFAGQKPIGQSINVFGRPREVVGVVGDIRIAGFTAPPRPAVYLPMRQNPMSFVSILVRTPGDPMQMVGAVRNRIRDVDRELSPYNMTSLTGGLHGSLAQPRLTALLITGFALAALSLAALGIYGMISYSVAQRAGEIGIRLAIGARSLDIYIAEAGRLIKRIAVGLVLGTAAAFGLAKFLESLVHQVNAADPAVILGVSATVLIVAIAASCIPIRRLLRLDPVRALRQE
jgi:putative ABC transport system permease protein